MGFHSEDLVVVVNQGNEADEFARRNQLLPINYSDELQLLRVGRADGNNHSSRLAELVEQHGRQIGSSGGNKDRVERSVGVKTERAVSGKNSGVGIAEHRENAAGALG